MDMDFEGIQEYNKKEGVKMHDKLPPVGGWRVDYTIDTHKIEALKAAVEFRSESLNTAESVVRTARIFESYLKEK